MTTEKNSNRAAELDAPLLPPHDANEASAVPQEEASSTLVASSDSFPPGRLMPDKEAVFPITSAAQPGLLGRINYPPMIAALKDNRELLIAIVLFDIFLPWIDLSLEDNTSISPEYIEPLATFLGWAVMTAGVAAYNGVEQRVFKEAIGVEDKTMCKAIQPFGMVFLPYLAMAMILTPIISSLIIQDDETPSWAPVAETIVGGTLGAGVALWGKYCLPMTIENNNQAELLNARAHMLKVLLAFNACALVLGVVSACGVNADNNDSIESVEKNALYIGSALAVFVALVDKWNQHSNTQTANVNDDPERGVIVAQSNPIVGAMQPGV